MRIKALNVKKNYMMGKKKSKFNNATLNINCNDKSKFQPY